MYEIIPGILEKDWVEIERKINIAKQFSKTASDAAAAIHIDIIDGKFAQNTTFLDPGSFAKYSQDLFFEVHLMVEEPIRYLRSFADAGFKRFLGHIEKMSDQVEFVAQGELLGEVGLAIDGPTPLDAIKVPYRDLDSILVMTIKAGESGQVFVPEYLKKVEMLKLVQHDIKIEVDGGINDKTIVEARNAGANRYVANSFLFRTNNTYRQYQLLVQKIHKY